MTHQQKKALENIMEKEEIARKEQIILFPQCFFSQSDNCIPIYPYFFDIFLFAAELEEPKIFISGKGLEVALQILGRKFYKNVKKIIHTSKIF